MSGPESEPNGIEPRATEAMVETATPADIPALAHLRSEQGWHPNARLLAAIQAWDGGRIFLLRESSLPLGDSSSTAAPPSSSTPVATASAIAAGPVGVIGNVIVRADYRRRGLGRVLMEASLRWLRARGVRHILLAATPDGRPLYTRLGFVARGPGWVAYRWVCALDPDVVRAQAGELRAHIAPAEALRSCASMDAAAFGGDRLGLLDLLLREPETWLYIVGGDVAGGDRRGGDSSAAPAGYLILRRLRSRRDTLQIGPWVARSEEAAAALLMAVLEGDATWRASFAPGDEPRLVVGADRREALDLLVAAGANLVEDDVVMQLDFAPKGAPGSSGHPGENATAGGPPQPVAAHPEWLYGWLAPMVF